MMGKKIGIPKLRVRLGLVMEILILCVLTISCSALSIYTRNSTSSTYRPVVIIHGVLADYKSMDDLKQLIQEVHPGTNVTAIDLYSDEDSLKPLWPQVRDFGEALNKIMQEATDGIHLICYSQGGVICRGILSTLPDHNVHNFISLSSPLMGQYGDTSDFSFLPPTFRKNIYLFCYYYGQDIFSVCQYWNDPNHQDLYREKSVFLAVVNNQTSHNMNSTEWKKNFLRIKNLVMIGGPDDGVITPWQSSHFGFYDSDLNIVKMENQTVFQKDYFGLQTLHNRGAIAVYEVAGVEHTHWHGNKTVFENCIKKWLD